MSDETTPAPRNRIGDGLTPVSAGDQGSAVDRDGATRAATVWQPPGWLPFVALFVTGVFGSVAAATTGVVATVFGALAAGGTMLMGFWGMRSGGTPHK